MHTSRVFRFAGFELDASLRELRRDGRVVPLQPKPLALLPYLLHQRDRVVSRAELLEALWPGVVVQEDALGFALHAARRAVGDDGKRQRVIRTVPRQGFRLVAAVERAASGAAEGFVGREPALAALRANLADALAGRGRIVASGPSRIAGGVGRARGHRGCSGAVALGCCSRGEARGGS